MYHFSFLPSFCVSVNELPAVSWAHFQALPRLLHARQWRWGRHLKGLWSCHRAQFMTCFCRFRADLWGVVFARGESFPGGAGPCIVSALCSTWSISSNPASSAPCKAGASLVWPLLCFWAALICWAHWKLALSVWRWHSDGGEGSGSNCSCWGLQGLGCLLDLKMGKVGLGRLSLLQLGDLVCRSDAISTRSPPFPTSPLYPVPSFGSLCAQGSDPTRTWSFSPGLQWELSPEQAFSRSWLVCQCRVWRSCWLLSKEHGGLVVFVLLSFTGGLLGPFWKWFRWQLRVVGLLTANAAAVNWCVRSGPGNIGLSVFLFLSPFFSLDFLSDV